MKLDITKVCSMWLYLLIIVFCVICIFMITNITKAEEYIDLDKIQASNELDIFPLECSIERETPPESFMGQHNSQNGLTIYRFDTNKDGVGDVQIAIPQGDPNRYPLLYSFDRTYNNAADITYVDQVRDGTCSGIQVYWTRGKGLLQPDVQYDYRKGA